MYDRREIDGAIAELENAEPTMQRVLDALGCVEARVTGGI